jgi:hypothetical protein
VKAGRFVSKNSFVHFVAIVTISILATGCGDGTDSPADAALSGSPSSGGAGSGNSGGSAILTIYGTPPQQILAGSPFRFVPTVNNPNDFALTFSVSNLPRWATLNKSTGVISGTPGLGDVGTYSGIRISVSGGGMSDTTAIFEVEVTAVANGSATLSWVPPSEHTDGRPLVDLAGYRVYYGQSQNNLNQSMTIANPGITNYVIENLTPATWYFAATAYDTVGAESTFSNVASKTIF